LSLADAVSNHYARFWGNVFKTDFRSGPMFSQGHDFYIVKSNPRADRPVWTYATAGMSNCTRVAGLELHMFSNEETDEVSEILAAVAHFHLTGSQLDLGHTVNFGKPWTGTSRCTYGLISLPYLDGPNLENFFVGDRVVKCFWLIPITLNERQYKIKHGLEALEELFESGGVDYANPNRLSMAE